MSTGQLRELEKCQAYIDICSSSHGLMISSPDFLPYAAAPSSAPAAAAPAAGRRRLHGHAAASQAPFMEAYRVTRAVKTPRHNAERLLEPVA